MSTAPTTPPAASDDGFRIFRDGTAWCAVGPGFTNLQESPAGFGDTPAAALSALCAQGPAATPDASPRTLVDLYRDRAELRAEIAKANQRHAEWLHRNEAVLESLERQIADCARGLTPEESSIARFCLSVRGEPDTYERKLAIRAAIDELLRPGAGKLRHEYIGLKDYAHWTDQREDHRYGYGPRHGYIRFAIGLCDPSRPLTDAQRDVCVKFLNSLLHGQQTAGAQS